MLGKFRMSYSTVFKLFLSVQELEELRSLTEVKKELEAAKEKIENYESYKEEWQSELSKSDDALELARTELKNINDQLEASEKAKNELKDRVVKFGSRQESLDDKIEALEGENDDLKYKLEEAKENVVHLEITVSQLELKANELEDDLAIGKANLVQSNKTIEELNSLIAAENAKEKLAELEQQLMDLKEANQVLNVDQNAIETELKQKQQNLELQAKVCKKN